MTGVMYKVVSAFFICASVSMVILSLIKMILGALLKSRVSTLSIALACPLEDAYTSLFFPKNTALKCSI